MDVQIREARIMGVGKVRNIHRMKCSILGCERTRETVVPTKRIKHVMCYQCARAFGKGFDYAKAHYARKIRKINEQTTKAIAGMTLLILMIVLPVSATSINCTGDNLKCYSPIVRGNTVNMTLNEWYFNYLAQSDGGEQRINLRIDKIATKPNVWMSINPTVKVTCDDEDYEFVRPYYSSTMYRRFTFTPSCSNYRASAFAVYNYGMMLTDTINESKHLLTSGVQMPIVWINNSNLTCIALVFRQHSGEAYSSFYYQGMKDKLKTVNATILVFPMANPSGVNSFRYTNNVYAQDLNNHWEDDTVEETNVMKQEIAKLNDMCGKIDLYTDWHGGNLGNVQNWLVMYYTQKERELYQLLRVRTLFNNSQSPESRQYYGRSSTYMRQHYNATVLTFEIQMHRDDIGTPQKMREDSIKVLDTMVEYLGVGYVNNTLEVNETEPVANVTVNETVMVSIKKLSEVLNMTSISEEDKEFIIRGVQEY